jgi:hypothetical protein
MIHNSRIAHSERLSVGANPVRKVGASEAEFVPSGSQVGVGSSGPFTSDNCSRENGRF